MHRSTILSPRLHRGCRALGAALALLASSASAEIVWHENLPAARVAGTASGKPVLAIFVAAWSPEATRFREQTLASPEVAGLIEACFEATIIDVDADPALARRMQVSHVPSACLFGAKGPPLASFECTEQPLAFLAAATKAAQEAAAARALAESSGPDAAATKTSDVPDAGLPTFSIDGDSLAREADASAAVSQGSISLVTAKVRQLSDFATAAVPQPAPAIASAAPPAMSFRSSPQPAAALAAGTAAMAGSPALPVDPPTWPAEQAALAASFTNAPQPASGRPSIEPAGSPTVASAPWLSAAPAAAAAASEQPEASATATDLHTPAGGQSTWSSLVSAMTKPFAKSAPQASPPPTMPAAKPAAPVAEALTTAIAPPPAIASSPTAVDSYGSMPLGLEGYCPVTVAERGVWTEGRAQWGVRHRGRTYLFAGPEQQQAFLASPDTYSPVLSGDDPVIVFDQGRSTPGRRAYGVTYQSRMYLFSSAETRATFAANPERYTSSVMLAERPTLVDAVRRY